MSTSDRRPGDPPAVVRQRRGHLRPRENWYRDVILVLVCGLLVAALAANQNTVGRLNRVVRDQEIGRHFAVGAICAAVSAVAEAGRTAIEGGANPLPPRLEHELERFGYPPPSVRRPQSQKAALRYVQTINSAIEAQIGKDAKLVRANGTLNCDELQRLAKSAGG